LRTLLDRELIRVIGKKEDVGRPLLYGTTPEFLRIFSLRDLTELPTLREFHELNAENTAKVEAKHGKAGPAPGDAASPGTPVEPGGPDPSASPFAPAVKGLGTGPDPAEEDALLDELDRATVAASQAAGPMEPQTPADPPPPSET
jgi:segregation and condensation protein B